MFVCRDFAYVSVDAARGSHTCHVFRSDTAACQISDTLHSVTDQTSQLRTYINQTETSMRHQAVVTDIISATSRTDAGALRPNSLPNLTTDNCCRDRDAGQLTRDAGQLTTCPMLTDC